MSTDDDVSRRELFGEGVHVAGRVAGQLLGIQRLVERLDVQATMARLPDLSDEALTELMTTASDPDLISAVLREDLRRLGQPPDAPA